LYSHNKTLIHAPNSEIKLFALLFSFALRQLCTTYTVGTVLVLPMKQARWKAEPCGQNLGYITWSLP